MTARALDLVRAAAEPIPNTTSLDHVARELRKIANTKQVLTTTKRKALLEKSFIAVNDALEDGVNKRLIFVQFSTLNSIGRRLGGHGFVVEVAGVDGYAVHRWEDPPSKGGAQFCTLAGHAKTTKSILRLMLNDERSWR